MPPEIKIKYSAIKFFPQSQKVSRPKKGNSYQEEKPYLEGIFANQDEYAKGTARVWFYSDEEYDLAWEFSQQNKAVLVIGDKSKTENSDDSKIIDLYKARIARYNANGKFALTIPGQSEPDILEGTPKELVILEVVIHATLIQPSTSTAGGSGQKKLGLKARHALQQQQKENQTPS